MTARAIVSHVAFLAVLPALGGCATVAQVVNLSDTTCGTSFEAAMSSILSDQGEKPGVAADLSAATRLALGTGAYGPRPFLVASSSGTDYSFFVQKKGARCLLRLYGRQKGFKTYTNNLTYIATRELAACGCIE